MAGEKDAMLLNETSKRLFFLGFGNVNRALAKMLLDPTKAALFADHGGFKLLELRQDRMDLLVSQMMYLR